LLAGATVILFAGSFGWTIYDARLKARQQALQQAGNIALAIEAEIARAVIGLDQSIQAAVKGMATPGLETMDPALRQAILFTGAPVYEGSNGVFIHNETGRLMYESVSIAPQSLNISDRGYFQVHRSQHDLGLVISPPIRAHVDGKWIIVLSRRINHPDGSFAGVVARPLNLSFFRSLFDALDIGRGGDINLANADGLLVTRRPFEEQDIGRDLSSSALFNSLRRAPAGAFEAKSSIDRIIRLYSYRRVENLPLVIGVGIPLREIYAPWLQRTLILATVLLVCLLISGFAASAVWREIWRRRQGQTAAERRAAEALSRLNTLFGASVDMMVVVRVTDAGEFVYEAVNPVWEEMFGLPATQAIGQSPLVCPAAKFAETVTAGLRQCHEQILPVRVAFTIPKPNQTRHWEGLITPVLSQDGKIRAMIAVARNTTERNLFEAGLRQSQRMEAMGQLTAGVAHDFNNMLQGILGSLDLLHDQAGLDDEGRACVDVAADAARRGATLVHRLLAFSRKQPLDPVLLRPEHVVADMAQLLSHVLGAQIRLETLVEEQPGPVCADLSQLQNCLFNLAINARDAMPSGGAIRLRVGNASVESVKNAGLLAGEYTFFAMQDEGDGMTPETLERALEPFFTTKPVGQGTGLGLPMVQGFARQSGGDLRIQTSPGQGTTVTMWLPRARRTDEVAADPPKDSREPADPARPRVLVVDDEAGVRQTLSLFLTKAGYVAIAADDALAALKLIRSGERVDLVIADQSMPGLTGSDLIGEIGLIRPDLPSVLITGYDKVGGLGELLGRVTVLRKPFSRSTFLRQIQAMVGSPTVPGIPPTLTHGFIAPRQEAKVIPLRAGPLIS
jgi:PAS domain S-box-containing protein